MDIYIWWRDNESAPVKGGIWIQPTYTTEKRALSGELGPVPVCFIQLVDKRYPLKRVLIKTSMYYQSDHKMLRDQSVYHKVSTEQ